MTTSGPVDDAGRSTVAPSVGPGVTARQRAREQTERDLLRIARRHLGEVGAAALSLRAIAREHGVVSSAVYRYFPSRDELLTRLIVEAFDELGSHVERAEARVSRKDFRGRFESVARAIRDWALAYPHQYALIYGSPVPGYVAPQDTVSSAARVGNVLFLLLRDVWNAGLAPSATPALEDAAPGVAAFASGYGQGVPGHLVVLGIESWSRLHGAVSFEVFGQFNKLVEDSGAFYEFIIDEEMHRLGL
jgi:AcrR family transcriptional regulator